jgi:hypothetical protein
MIKPGDFRQRSLAINRNDAASEPGRKPIQAIRAKLGPPPTTQFSSLPNKAANWVLRSIRR